MPIVAERPRYQAMSVSMRPRASPTKEYAPRSKPGDTGFDMSAFHDAIRYIMAGTGEAGPPISFIDEAGRPTICRGDRGENVEACQQTFGVEADGRFGVNTEVAVRKLQRVKQLVADGIVGPLTWRELASR